MDGVFGYLNGNFFGCQVWVGIDGGFGEMKVGLQFLLFVFVIFGLDLCNVLYFGVVLVLYVDNVFVMGFFNLNVILYMSLIIVGLMVSVMFGFGGKVGDFQVGCQYFGSFIYMSGGFMFNVVFYDGNGGMFLMLVLSMVVFVGCMIGVVYMFGLVIGKVLFMSYKVVGLFSNNVYSVGFDYCVMLVFDLNIGVWYMIDCNDLYNYLLLVVIGVDYSLLK